MISIPRDLYLLGTAGWAGVPPGGVVPPPPAGGVVGLPGTVGLPGPAGVTAPGIGTPAGTTVWKKKRNK